MTAKAPASEALTLSFSQALPLTGLSRNTLYSLLKAGEVPGARTLGTTAALPSTSAPRSTHTGSTRS